MVKEDHAWRMRVPSPTTTASSFQTGRKRGCSKLQGNSGQQKEWKVRNNIQDGHSKYYSLVTLKEQLVKQPC